MAKLNLKPGFVKLIILSAFILKCSCDCQSTSEIPSSVDDYIENISAHFKNEIQILEADLSQMESSFAKQISLVTYNIELAAKLARQLESRMRSTASLNVKGKLCIQHFIGNVTGEHVNLQNRLRACVDAGKAAGKNLPDAARTQARNARTQLHELQNTDLALCRKNNGNNEQKLTDCVREKLKIREVNVQNMMKASGKEIEASSCRADIIARTAQECSFIVILGTESLLSEIVANINTCIGDRLLEIK